MKKLLATAAAMMVALFIHTGTAAAQDTRYVAEELGLTVDQLSEYVARGKEIGLNPGQTVYGLQRLVAGLRNIKLEGSRSYEWHRISSGNNGSGYRLLRELKQVVSGPGGYGAGIRFYLIRVSGMNMDAQKYLAEVFGYGSIAFRDLDKRD